MKAILFDLDDTLIPSTAAFQYAELQMLTFFQQNHAPQVTLGVLETEWKEARARAKQLVGEMNPSAHNRMLYLKQFLDKRVQKCPPQLALRLIGIYEKSLLEKLHLREATRLWQLRTKLPFALVTDETTLTQLKKLSVVDPEGDLFNHIVTSEEVGQAKPSPVIFKEALRRLGVAGHDAIYVGDHIEKDIGGANACGIPCFWITEQKDAKLPTGRKAVGQGSLGMALDWIDRHLG